MLWPLNGNSVLKVVSVEIDESLLVDKLWIEDGSVVVSLFAVREDVEVSC